MLGFPPLPLFTFVGFLIHTIVMISISARVLLRSNSKAMTYFGIGIFAYAVDFSLITILFYLFENTIIKTHIFIIIASLLVPFGTLFLLLSVLELTGKSRRVMWGAFVIGAILVVVSYIDTIQNLGDPILYSSIHPAYPRVITASQGFGGVIAALVVAIFFLYNAFRSNLFVKQRALILGVASILLGLSSFYWISDLFGTNLHRLVYIVTHTIGPMGSLLLAYGFFGIKANTKISQSVSQS